MAEHIVKNVDGEKRRRIFVTGRTPKPEELRKRRRNITLSPRYDDLAKSWLDKYGVEFSPWVENQMEVFIHTETV